MDKPIQITQEKAARGANWHAGPLMGCATVWFATAEAARLAVQKLGHIPSGRHHGKCRLCKANYKPSDPNYKSLPYQYACEKYKEQIAGCSQK